MMLYPGYHDLGPFTITTAGTFTGEWVEDLDGVLSLAVQFRFIFGSGGTSVKAYLQTSLDDGDTVVDIASVVFGNTVSEVAAFNFSSLTPKTTQVTPTDAALADDTNVDGLLGDRFRVKIVVVGTYAGSTTLNVTAVAR
jgi:aspartate aminotransferase-like enzyme